MLDFVTICPSEISSIAIGQRAAYIRSDMTAARTWMHRMKSPVAIFMVLLLVAIKAMVASETLHEAVCDHQHGQHEEQRDAQQPQHECVVKLFSQGMVDSTDSSTPLPPISRVTVYLSDVSERLIATDLSVLPPGRAPPVFHA